MGEWISVKDRLPDTSREVIIAFVPRSFMMIVNYSAKHKAFNAFDNDDEEHVAEFSFDDVTHWRELPELPKE